MFVFQIARENILLSLLPKKAQVFVHERDGLQKIFYYLNQMTYSINQT